MKREYTIMWLEDQYEKIVKDGYSWQEKQLFPKIVDSVTVDAETMEEAKHKARVIFMSRHDVKDSRNLNCKLFLSYKGEIPFYPNAEKPSPSP